MSGGDVVWQIGTGYFGCRNEDGAFNTAKEFILFLKEIKQMAEGRPTGFKLCVGKKSEFTEICQAMLDVGFTPDFITVDGSEGGTGAAPLEFTNYIGLPLFEGLAFVHDTLVQKGLRKKIKVIASGKVFTGFDILTRLAMGADVVNSARGMMLALGCIQALKCHTNHCPVGVTSHNPQLERGLYVPDKAERVARFHAETVHAFADILGAMGYSKPSISA